MRGLKQQAKRFQVLQELRFCRFGLVSGECKFGELYESVYFQLVMVASILIYRSLVQNETSGLVQRAFSWLSTFVDGR